ncbi:hypothetical protein STCU_07966 [Strigomonas culicis]|uniref:Uncharacterized protein n=1 Tax=Strigomonas culicis TaxID=28005 RepID=S9U229_9TRYP|nr:hypothetical protein STCU_07966 [Strigomonas culicis]|eukprot:EPY22993.1 hypothetical protein STCU_07966 [Strigomonas culicis]
MFTSRALSYCCGRTRLLRGNVVSKEMAAAANRPAAPCGSSSPAAAHEGTVTAWHPFERTGSITDGETGEVFTIANTRAFETVLPTMLRTLEGARVRFTVDRAPQADRVIVRNHVVPITAESYTVRPPVDFVNPLNAPQQPPCPEKAPGRYAKDIVVDIQSIPSDKLVRLSGPLVDEEVVAPTKNLKDMRSSRVLDRDTNEYLRLKRQLGSAAEAREVLDARRAEEARHAVRREVVARQVSGTVVAWSPLHRSGAVREGPATAADPTSTAPVEVQEGAAGVAIIRNVHCFQSALPTSQTLLQRRVTYDKVAYSSHPGKCFAEAVVVEGALGFDASVASVEAARQEKEREKQAERRRRQMGTAHVFADDPAAALPVPEGEVYGVITRWSGGQGTLESGDGRLYYIQSAADFVQLMREDTHGIRGAVVTFRVAPEQPRYAREVDILSTATSSVEEMRPMLDRVPGSSTRVRAPAAAADATAVVMEPNERTGVPVPRSVAVEPEGVDWAEGTLIAWSAIEGQGIIHGGDGERYVLRDPAEHVIAYRERRHLLAKGRKVKFTAYGATGLLACNVVPLDGEASEAEVREAELRVDEPQYSMDGNVSEAIASPMSTSYWMNRMDKAGYDTAEIKQLQNRALTLDEDDDDDGTEGGKFLDSDDLFKKDHWWNDPKKNIRLPNSDMTAGHLALMGPASMMNFAMKAKDPKKLDKMAQKYNARLTEGQKEYAWKQAKEMAPKYESLIKKARAKNEEPTFYFF